MRINRDKLNKLAHTVADTLADIAEVDFLEDRDRKSTRLNSSHYSRSRMPSSA